LKHIPPTAIPVRIRNAFRQIPRYPKRAMRNIIGYTSIARAGNGNPKNCARGEIRTLEHEKVLLISQKVEYDPVDSAIFVLRVYA